MSAPEKMQEKEKNQSKDKISPFPIPISAYPLEKNYYKGQKHPISLKSNLSSQSSDLPILVAGLVHETRNPLAAMHLHLQLLDNYTRELQDPLLKEKITTKIILLQTEIKRLNQTLTNFSKFQIDPDPIKATPISHRKEDEDQKKVTAKRTNSPFSLNTIVKEILDLLEPQIKEANIKTILRFGKIEIIQGMELSFVRQIVLNLLLNSIQALYSYKLQMEPSIEIVTAERNNLIYIIIRDNGPGISEEKKDKIFQLFYSTKKNVESKEISGLGLYLVYKILALLNGRLELDSKKGKGTSFTIVLQRPLKAIARDSSKFKE